MKLLPWLLLWIVGCVGFRLYWDRGNALRHAICDLDRHQIELRAYQEGRDPVAAFEAGVLGTMHCGTDGIVIHYGEHREVLAERCVYYMGCKGEGRSHDLGVLSSAELARAPKR